MMMKTTARRSSFLLSVLNKSFLCSHVYLVSLCVCVSVLYGSVYHSSVVWSSCCALIGGHYFDLLCVCGLQVVHEAYTRFTEESLMQSVCDKPSESTEVTIKVSGQPDRARRLHPWLCSQLLFLSFMLPVSKITG